MTSFGTRLVELRKSRKTDQAELAGQIGVTGSSLSLYETDKRTPKSETIPRIIAALRLTKKEAEELIQLGGYDPQTILKETNLDFSHYPRTMPEHVLPRLKGDYGKTPALYVRTDTTIAKFNLLAAYVWFALDIPRRLIMGEKLFTFSVYSLYAREENFARIAAPFQKQDFLYVKTHTFKKLEGELPEAARAAFGDRIEHNPILSLIYEHPTLDPGNEWQYILRIKSPVDPDKYLTFHGMVERVMEGNKQTGFLISYHPIGIDTITVMEEVYRQAIDTFGEEAFVQELIEEITTEPLPLNYPVYYPTLTFDELFFITSENKAYEWMVKEDVVRKFLLDIFVSGKTRELMEEAVSKPSLADVPAIGALRMFFSRTKPYQVRSHPLNKAYQQARQQLTTAVKYEGLLELFWRYHQPTLFDKEIEDGAVQCSPVLACRYAVSVQLSFDAIVHFPNLRQEKYLNRVNYSLVLRPTNTETEIALILFQIEDIASKRKYIGTTVFDQSFWLLYVVTTVQELLLDPLGDPGTVFLTNCERLAPSDKTEEQGSRARQQVYVTLFELYNYENTASKFAVHDIFEGFCEQLGACHAHTLLRHFTTGTDATVAAPALTNGHRKIVSSYVTAPNSFPASQ